MVPGGQLTTSAPFGPLPPDVPDDPDVNKLGFARAAALHCASVTLVPDVPAGGVFLTELANDAVNAETDGDDGRLAVVAVNA